MVVLVRVDLAVAEDEDRGECVDMVLVAERVGTIVGAVYLGNAHGLRVWLLSKEACGMLPSGG